MTQQEKDRLEQHVKDSIRDSRLDKITIEEQVQNLPDERLISRTELSIHLRSNETEGLLFATEVDNRRTKHTK